MSNKNHPTVDVSRLLKVLGIKHPVRIVPTDLNQGMPASLALEVLGTIGCAAVDIRKPDEIKVDWDAVAYQLRTGEPARYSDPATVIAHEMVHVKQVQELGVDAVRVANMTHAYDENPIELEAYELAPELAQYVSVQP